MASRGSGFKQQERLARLEIGGMCITGSGSVMLRGLAFCDHAFQAGFAASPSSSIADEKLGDPPSSPAQRIKVQSYLYTCA